MLSENGAPDGGAANLVLERELHHEGLPLAGGGLEGDVPGPGRGEAEQLDLELGVGTPGHHGGGPAVAAYQAPDLLTAARQDPEQCNVLQFS